MKTSIEVTVPLWAVVVKQRNEPAAMVSVVTAIFATVVVVVTAVAELWLVPKLVRSVPDLIVIVTDGVLEPTRTALIDRILIAIGV